MIAIFTPERLSTVAKLGLENEIYQKKKKVIDY